MEIKAQLRHLRIAPRKVRLVLGLVRGLDAKDAESQLQLISKRGSDPVLKLLRSAIANAKNAYGIEKDNLYIHKIFANEGQTLKRWLPRAFGRASSINRRSSHIVVVLKSKDDVQVKKKKKAKVPIAENISQGVQSSSKLGSVAAKQSGKQNKRTDSEKMRRSVAKPSVAKRVFRRKSV